MPFWSMPFWASVRSSSSLETNYQHVPGIAAATILGDGRVALILDVDAVVAGSRVAATGFEQLCAAAG